MQIFCFNSIEEAIVAYPDYKPASKEKNRHFNHTPYFKLGSNVIKHDSILWRVGRFFKAFGITLLFFTLFSNNYRKLITRSWKQCKRGEETRASIYVKKKLEIKKIELEVPLQPKEHPKVNEPNEPLLSPQPEGKNSSALKLELVKVEGGLDPQVIEEGWQFIDAARESYEFQSKLTYRFDMLINILRKESRQGLKSLCVPERGLGGAIYNHFIGHPDVLFVPGLSGSPYILFGTDEGKKFLIQALRVGFATGKQMVITRLGRQIHGVCAAF